jgi:competence protein ComEA
MRAMVVLALWAAAGLRAAAGTLDLNTASQAELEQLKGIGVAMSERLLQARASAPFADWQDVMARVPGVGPRVAQHWSAQGLTVHGEGFDPPATEQAASAVTRPAASAASR